MSKGKLLIFGVLAVILSGFSLFFINKQHQPSYDDFTKVIIKEYPALERDNKPVFSIVSTKRYGANILFKRFLFKKNSFYISADV